MPDNETDPYIRQRMEEEGIDEETANYRTWIDVNYNLQKPNHLFLIECAKELRAKGYFKTEPIKRAPIFCVVCKRDIDAGKPCWWCGAYQEGRMSFAPSGWELCITCEAKEMLK